MCSSDLATLTGWTHGSAPPLATAFNKMAPTAGPGSVSCSCAFPSLVGGASVPGCARQPPRRRWRSAARSSRAGLTGSWAYKMRCARPFYSLTRYSCSSGGKFVREGSAAPPRKSRSRRRRGWSARLPALGRRQPSWVSPGTHQRCPCCRQANSVGETSPISRRDLQAAVNPPLVVSSFNQRLITGEIASNWLVLSLRTCRTF